MFRYVPACSGMFHVPDFIYGPSVTIIILKRNVNKACCCCRSCNLRCLRFLCGLAHHGYAHTTMPYSSCDLGRYKSLMKQGLCSHRTVIPEWFLKPRGVVIESPERTQDSQKQTLSNIFPTKNALQLIPITHDEMKRSEILKTPWPFRTCRFHGETVHALFFMDQL